MTSAKKATNKATKPATKPKAVEHQDVTVPSVRHAPTTSAVSAGQLVRTEDGRHGVVAEVTEDGPLVAFLPAPALYQLPLDPVA